MQRPWLRWRFARTMRTAAACAVVLGFVTSAPCVAALEDHPAVAPAALPDCSDRATCSARVEALLVVAARAHAQGQPEPARIAAEEALALAGTHAPGSLQQVAALRTLGGAELLRRNLVRTEALLLQAQGLLAAMPLQPDVQRMALSVRANLALVRAERRELPAAARDLEATLAEWQALAPEGRELLANLHNLGMVRKRLGQFDAAQALYLRALALQRSQQQPPDALVRTLLSLAQLELDRGRAQEAEPWLAEAQAWVDRALPQGLYRANVALLQATRAEALGDVAAAVARRSESIALRRQLAPDALQTAQAEAAQAASLRQLGDIDAALAHYAAAVATLERQMAGLGGSELVRAEYRASQAEIYQGYLDLLWQRGEHARALRIDARYRHSQFARLAPPTNEAVVPAGRQTPSVRYLVARTRVWIIASDADGQVLLAQPCVLDANALADRIERLRTLLADPFAPASAQQAWRALARELGDALLLPALAVLPDADAIRLFPDGVLHHLPFAALRLPARACAKVAADCYALQRATFTLAVTAAARPQAIAPALRDAPHVVAFADPDYGVAAEPASERALLLRGAALQPLPGTRTEAETLRRLFGDAARVYLGDQATEASFRAHAGAGRLLHIGAHAVADSADPFEAYIALTPVADPGDDGLLRAREIALALRFHAELVTLSACDSGGGRVLDGEGLLGLAHAFRQAGARSVLAAQWRIDDTATALLMQAFYDAVRQGATPAEALRRAQGAMLAQHHGLAARLDAWWQKRVLPDYAHPFYWAAFALHDG